MGHHIEDSDALIESLCALPAETGWVEFKVDQFEPDSVGKYVSSLANSAIIAEKDHAYLVFGVENEAHEVVGTKVRLDRRKVGNEAASARSRKASPTGSLGTCRIGLDTFTLCNSFVVPVLYGKKYLYTSISYADTLM
jgi:hypothetical protein